MFAGSEGPARAVAGRYEGRQTRQALSALFWHFFHLQSPARRRRAPLGSECRHRRGRHRLGGDRRWGAAPRSFLYTSYSEPTHLKAPIRAGAVPAPQTDDAAHDGRLTATSITWRPQTGCRRRSAWDSPACLGCHHPPIAPGPRLDNMTPAPRRPSGRPLALARLACGCDPKRGNCLLEPPLAQRRGPNACFTRDEAVASRRPACYHGPRPGGNLRQRAHSLTFPGRTARLMASRTTH